MYETQTIGLCGIWIIKLIDSIDLRTYVRKGT